MSSPIHIKLSELTAKIGQALKDAFQSDTYWVVAEISSHKFYPDQDRHYMELIEKAAEAKDPIAKVKCIAWREGARQIEQFEKETGQPFANDIQVLVKVKIEFHGAYGLSLILSDIDTSFTLGNIEKQRRLTLQKLVAENPDAVSKVGEEYLTNNKKAKLNAVVQQIAIVGSPKSEGYVDFIHTLTHNQFQYRFITDIYQSSVQGAEAENDLVESLVAIFKSGQQYDAVVIIRGGGAKTDFLVFDSYRICRTVARFPIPIITGIGHHNDVSIVDMLVNKPTKTPTQAAEFIIAHNRKFEEAVISLQKTVVVRSQQLLAREQQQIHRAHLSITNRSQSYLARYKESLQRFHHQINNRSKAILYSSKHELYRTLHQLSAKPLLMTGRRHQELEHLKNHIGVMAAKFITAQKGWIAHQESMIKVMSPESTLNRGFAMVMHKGKLKTNAQNIQPGDELSIIMKDETIDTKVTAKKNNHG